MIADRARKSARFIVGSAVLVLAFVAFATNGGAIQAADAATSAFGCGPDRLRAVRLPSDPPGDPPYDSIGDENPMVASRAAERQGLASLACVVHTPVNFKEPGDVGRGPQRDRQAADFSDYEAAGVAFTLAMDGANRAKNRARARAMLARSAAAFAKARALMRLNFECTAHFNDTTALVTVAKMDGLAAPAPDPVPRACALHYSADDKSTTLGGHPQHAKNGPRLSRNIVIAQIRLEKRLL